MQSGLYNVLKRFPITTCGFSPPFWNQRNRRRSIPTKLNSFSGHKQGRNHGLQGAKGPKSYGATYCILSVKKSWSIMLFFVVFVKFFGKHVLDLCHVGKISLLFFVKYHIQFEYIDSIAVWMRSLASVCHLAWLPIQ